MIIAFYSHAKNTRRFLERHFVEALEKRFPGEKLQILDLIADGPHKPLKHVLADGESTAPQDLFLVPGPMLLITPTYGQFDQQDQITTNFTPRAVEDFLLQCDISENSHYYAISGNRTFGKHFAQQDRIPDSFKHVGSFELAGSDTDAERIVDNLFYAIENDKDN